MGKILSILRGGFLRPFQWLRGGLRPQPAAGAHVRRARRTRAYDVPRCGGNAHQRRIARRAFEREMNRPPWFTEKEWRRHKLAAA